MRGEQRREAGRDRERWKERRKEISEGGEPVRGRGLMKSKQLSGRIFFDSWIWSGDACARRLIVALRI